MLWIDYDQSRNPRRRLATWPEQTTPQQSVTAEAGIKLARQVLSLQASTGHVMSLPSQFVSKGWFAN
jgi:hypothetical protein